MDNVTHEQKKSLPDYIREGKKYPPVKFDLFEHSVDEGEVHACVLGGAQLAWDPNTDTKKFQNIYQLWPLFRATGINPLARVVFPEKTSEDRPLVQVIYRLFDCHNYTHDQIADWLESLDQEQISLKHANLKDLINQKFVSPEVKSLEEALA